MTHMTHTAALPACSAKPMPRPADPQPVHLTDAQARALYAALCYRKQVAQWSQEQSLSLTASTRASLCLTPLAEGGEIPFWPSLIFPHADALDKRSCVTLAALADAGVVVVWHSPARSLMRLRPLTALLSYRAWYANRGKQRYPDMQAL